MIDVTKCYRSKQQDLLNLLGAMYSAVMFLGGTNTSAVQSVVSVERTVFYREKGAGMYSALPYAFAQVKKEKFWRQDAKLNRQDHFVTNEVFFFFFEL